ncbi:hypothetical protein QJS66_09815 [Kocuria rhizophila]|nr:hypothetical protein QJS66_09815 [Kocuria rhizophila]
MRCTVTRTGPARTSDVRTRPAPRPADRLGTAPDERAGGHGGSARHRGHVGAARGSRSVPRALGYRPLRAAGRGGCAGPSS